MIRVVGAANGTRTPHDGRFVVAWNPHTIYGDLELTSTDDINEARRFDPRMALTQWQTVSRVQPLRPDGEPNRPLAGISVELLSWDTLSQPLARRL